MILRIALGYNRWVREQGRGLMSFFVLFSLFSIFWGGGGRGALVCRVRAFEGHVVEQSEAQCWILETPKTVLVWKF